MSNSYARCINDALSSATDAQWAEAVAWYPSVYALCEKVSADTGHSLEHCAVAFAHLSPQLQYVVNVRAFYSLMYGGHREASVIRSSFERARASLSAADPWATFGSRAQKTRNFALNITGDESAVTVDSWIARCVGVDPTRVFNRPALYDEIASAFRRAAKRHGLAPCELQALVWIVTRGRAE